MRVQASGDQIIDGNKIYLKLSPQGQNLKPLLFSEVYAFSQGDESEWVEIKNTTNQTLDLSYFYLRSGNQKTMIPHQNLSENEYCVLAQDSALFRIKYGDLRVCLIQVSPWPSLADGGDTLELGHSLVGMVDQKYWMAAKENQKGLSLLFEQGVQLNNSQIFKSATPGYELPKIIQKQLSTPTQRVWSKSKDTKLTWDVDPSAFGSVEYKILDLHGSVWTEGLVSEPTQIIWDFTKNGASYPNGPVNLYVKEKGQRARFIKMVIAP